MRTLNVALGDRSYDILITTAGFDHIVPALSDKKYKKLFVVSDENVLPIYESGIRSSLSQICPNIYTKKIPAGESSKSFSCYESIITEALNDGLDRYAAIIALGGGVVGDLAGFAASTYMRGIDFIQVPTSLLAQVDSSVGGKVAINHPLGKNMVGSFYQPSLVYINLETLKTLPEREFSTGLAELIKHGFIWDAGFLDYLESNLDNIMRLDLNVLENAIYTSCKIKKDIVERDEKETSIRAILNFGHTIGHAIETCAGYFNFNHGEAVAIGMYYESLLSLELGLIDSTYVNRLVKLLSCTGLPHYLSILDTDKLIDKMYYDKKNKDGKIVFVIPTGFGSVQIFKDINVDLLRKVLKTNEWK